jgi:hypothetical protein
MSAIEQASRLFERYPLNGWESEWLADYESRIKAMSPATEGERRSRLWWLDYIGQEIDRRTPPVWWPQEWKDKLTAEYK